MMKVDSCEKQELITKESDGECGMITQSFVTSTKILLLMKKVPIRLKA